MILLKNKKEKKGCQIQVESRCFKLWKMMFIGVRKMIKILNHLQFEKMFEASKKQLPPKSEGSREMQVLRSIDAHSALSIEQGESQQLMMRLLMLSIEIDRKDQIIQELMEIIRSQDSRRIIEELTLRCQKYEVEVKTLTETIVMLKQNISSIETNKNKEMFTSITQFNEQLQTKVILLQNKLRQVQQQKIDLEEKINQNKVNQALSQFTLFKNNEKGRVRELQNQLAVERARGQTERKTLIQKNCVLEEMRIKIIEYENREKLMIAQCEDKLRSFQNEMVFHDNLKKSQIMSTEERLNATSVQLASLNEEVRTLKQQNQHLRSTIQIKEKQIVQVSSEFKTLETRFMRTETELKEISNRFEVKNLELKAKEKELGEKAVNSQKLENQIDQLRYTFAAKGQEAQLYSQQTSRLKTQIIELEAQLESYRLQNKKLKKKSLTQATLCQGCRARELSSNSMIASQKNLKGIGLEQIINQTEQLFKSNRKIQSLITRHDSFCQSSIHVYNTRTNDI